MGSIEGCIQFCRRQRGQHGGPNLMEVNTVHHVTVTVSVCCVARAAFCKKGVACFFGWCVCARQPYVASQVATLRCRRLSTSVAPDAPPAIPLLLSSSSSAQIKHSPLFFSYISIRFFAHFHFGIMILQCMWEKWDPQPPNTEKSQEKWKIRKRT